MTKGLNEESGNPPFLRENAGDREKWRIGILQELGTWLSRFDIPLIQLKVMTVIMLLIKRSKAAVHALLGTEVILALREVIRKSVVDDLKNRAVCLIGYIASEGPICRQTLIQNNFPEVISTEALKSMEDRSSPHERKLHYIRNISMALSSLTRPTGRDEPRYLQFRCTFPYFSRAFQEYFDDESIIADNCWSLANLMTDHENFLIIEEIIRFGFCPQLVRTLKSAKGDDERLDGALRATGNIATGTDQQTQVLLDNDFLGTAALLLENPELTVVRETCWVLSNITAGTRDQIQQFLEYPGLLTKVASILNKDDKRWLPVRIEAAWCQSNAIIMGTSKQQEALISSACIRAFCELLRSCKNINIHLVGQE
ncbi:unnamed protein product [Soboliphyme baturini]|uniref:Armadillo/beta-catenin-like repeat protein n=1 Tax=Soboliphyme baturini TaxID=241478 RepID=A0A183IB45_9BILA|nr:unnamed protein product [Soboliphyme baturini]